MPDLLFAANSACTVSLPEQLRNSRRPPGMGGNAYAHGVSALSG